MARIALLILSGNAATSFFLLVRNLLIARLISVEDYGIGATFAVAMAIVEMASFLGLQQQIIQDRDGNDPRFQAALQGFQLLRGVIAAIVMFLMADWIAAFLGIPEVAWAYQLMAVVPLLNGLQHFDIHRLNREMRFMPLLLTGLLPAVLSVVAVWPLYLWFGDYRVTLYALIFFIAVSVATSHLMAQRPYQIAFDRAVIRRSLSFGWPLLVNGFLLFLVFQGDKMIVGRELGMETLAIFAMGMTLALSPALIISKSAQNFFLPQLSQSDISAAQFQQRGILAVETVLAMTLAFVLGMALLGPAVVHLLLGESYAELATLLIWFAIVQGLRIFKVGPQTIAMALGHTRNDMYANIARILVFPAAWYWAVVSGDLLILLGIALLGEALALIVALYLLQRRCQFPVRLIRRPMIGSVLALVVAGLLAGLPALNPQVPIAGPLLALIGAVVICAITYIALPTLRALLLKRRQGPTVQ
ncbi:oligosaccharide flippase family protein [Flavimaricola marinus]|uniref:Colanic acid exporter n=1 Tax=Flavimaricola marinus TaxID=1819565 RepID=A0A238LIR1_9RHOB|nr:oligosaccharide flippase family protein [Flavimaricola marinus]SMY09294.1 colanic acid exporter [Flavimaricola marinus]